MSAKEEVPAPPPYTARAEDAAEVDDLADEVHMNLNLDSLESNSELPTEDQALVHLRLLHIFYKLKTSVSAKDGLFGFHNEDVVASLSENAANKSSVSQEDLKTKLLTTLEEKRWAVFVTRAVDRFAKWWESLKKSTDCEPLTLYYMMDEGLTSAGGKAFDEVVRNNTYRYRLRPTQLPPVDVLMVWHAYMLNPRCYLEDCLSEGSGVLWQMDIPWRMINDSIDPRSEDYNPSSETKESFEAATLLKWDNVEGTNNSFRVCPNTYCGKPITIPYTTIDRLQIITWAKTAASGGSDEIPRGNGYADKGLFVQCPACRMDIDHEFLRAAKFVADYAFAVKDVDSMRRPMRGTILSEKGLVKRLQGSDPRTFPNRLLRAMAITDRPLWTSSSLDMIRKSIEAGLKSARTINKTGLHRPSNRTWVPREDRIYIRRMMSRYWDNSSPFGIDLVGAVMRQGSFIEKMENIDWLHSPTAKSTMTRLIKKYERFFFIMSTNPHKLIVPTLDIDLAWHTHQLSPIRYYNYSVKKTRTEFINHDDRVPELSLNKAFMQTSKIYQELYKEPYSQCTCWYCEAIRTTHHSSVSRLFKGSKIPEEELSLYDPSNPAPCDPEQGPHISAHNAVRPKMSGNSADQYRYFRYVEEAHKSLLSAYEKACKRAEKQGRPKPPKPPVLDRRQDYTTNAALPFYAFAFYPVGIPYIAYTCDPNVYACDPSGANVNPGGAGNCAAGSCGGGVAAGGCGGGAAAAGWGGPGACGGGAGMAGGCAGAGGFGGCGGGGGGGGGCGGGGGG